MNNKKLNEYKLAFVDTETTGLDYHQHEIIELATLIYNQQTDEIESEWETKIAPSHIETASPEALKINGYYNNPDTYTGNINSALIKFNSLVDGCIIVGQNISFDLGFIYYNMKPLNIKPSFGRRYLEMMGMAWFAIKDSDTTKMSLESFCNNFGIPNVGAHSALVDCRRTFEVYRHLKDFYRENK